MNVNGKLQKCIKTGVVYHQYLYHDDNGIKHTFYELAVERHNEDEIKVNPNHNEMKSNIQENTIRLNNDSQSVSPVNETRNSKKFQCEFCPNAYNRKRTLRHHIDAEHKGIRFKCKHCGTTVKYHGSLISHFEKYHPNQKCPSRSEMVKDIEKKTQIDSEPKQLCSKRVMVNKQDTLKQDVDADSDPDIEVLPPLNQKEIIQRKEP